MTTFGVLLALLVISVTTEAGAYRKLKRKIEDFTENVKTLEDEVPGKPSSNEQPMDSGVILGRSGSFGHSKFEKSKRFDPVRHYPCLDSPCKNGGTCISEGFPFTCLCPSSFKGQFCEQANGHPVIARWSNNKYYSANVLHKSNHQTTVIFTDGDKLTYSNGDVSAVLQDQAPSEVNVAQHVVAKYKGSKKYHIGFVIAKSADGYDVQFDDGDEDIYPLISQLRILSNQDSPHKLGARVFARYTNGKYYRGFVDSVTSSTVHIEYDDGSTIELKMNDPAAVILDELPCYTDVHPGQRVIAHWPGQSRYHSATVESKMSRGNDACYKKDAYNVLFDDGDEMREDFNHIRLIPT